MSYLKINGTDISHLVTGLKIGYEKLIAEGYGRNANGDAILEVINEKVKVYVTFRPMNGDEMMNFLQLIRDWEDLTITFRDSRTNDFSTVECYTGTPEPEYYWIHGNDVLYKPFSLNFIEL